MKKKFTRDQVNNWKKYELVRTTGFYNMHDPNAKADTGLTDEEYQFTQANYAELKQQARGSKI